MTFRKNNKLGDQKFLSRALDKQPITFRGYEGQKEALKTIPNWQERFRKFIEILINESKLDADFNPRVVFPPRSKDTGLPHSRLVFVFKAAQRA